MRNRIIFGIVKLITLTLLTLSILTMVAFQDDFFPQDNYLMGDPMTYSFSDINAYDEFLRSEQGLPKNFVTAHQLSQIGSFTQFSYAPMDDFLAYHYYYHLEEDFYVSVHITHETAFHFTRYTPISTFISYPPISIFKLGSSMLNLTTEDSGYILSNGLEYHYSRGKLSSIEWRANGVWFSLDIRTRSGEIPSSVSPDTIIGKLLSKSPLLQHQALRQLPNSVGNVGIPPSLVKTIVAALPYIAICLVAALLGQLFLPRYRKEHEHPRFYANNFRNL